MKVCYVTALGRWESDAYWANFWYQGDKTRRELLIESLFGHSNAEIAEIKDGFCDKKYHNSLAKCMDTELKEDKFKKCVMIALRGEREEEWNEHGQAAEIDWSKVADDVADLRKALKRGSESGVFKIVLARSDRHLKEVMKAYEDTYKSNLAREVIKKSGNLVVSNLVFLFYFILFYFYFIFLFLFFPFLRLLSQALSVHHHNLLRAYTNNPWGEGT